MAMLKNLLKDIKSEYAVVGFDRKGDFEILHEAHFLTEAQRWIDGYTRWGDTGGYDSIVAVDKETVTAHYYMQLSPH